MNSFSVEVDRDGIDFEAAGETIFLLGAIAATRIELDRLESQIKDDLDRENPE